MSHGVSYGLSHGVNSFVNVCHHCQLIDVFVR